MIRNFIRRLGWFYLLETSKDKGLFGVIATAVVANRLSEKE